MSLDLLYVFVGEVSVQVLSYYLIGLLVLEWSHVSSLYIWEIKPLCEVSVANMFSHMVGSLFILILFSTVAAPVCIPTNSALGFPFLDILASTCLLLWL